MPYRRHSKKRDAIQELIRSSELHPSAQWVHKQLKPRHPDLSLGTVYRNIKILLEKGALASAGVVNGEERFDGKLQPHPHAVCKCCGLIIDLQELNHDFGLAIPGFEIDMRNTVFYGLCAGCISAGCMSAEYKETTALGR